MNKTIKYVLYAAAAFVIFLLVKKYLKKGAKPNEPKEEGGSGGGGGGGTSPNNLPTVTPIIDMGTRPINQRTSPRVNTSPRRRPGQNEPRRR